MISNSTKSISSLIPIMFLLTCHLMLSTVNKLGYHSNKYNSNYSISMSYSILFAFYIHQFIQSHKESFLKELNKAYQLILSIDENSTGILSDILVNQVYNPTDSSHLIGQLKQTLNTPLPDTIKTTTPDVSSKPSVSSEIQVQTSSSMTEKPKESQVISNTNSTLKKKKRRASKKRSNQKKQAPPPPKLEPVWSDEVPPLSDNESVAESVESTESTESIESTEFSHYYSLFSTGFDFGVPSTHMVQPKQEQQFYSHHLASFRPPSVTRITQPKRSLIEMLDQDQDAETTITPACFSYFGEMIMTNSIHQKEQLDHPHFDLSKFREQWNSIV